MQEPKRTGRRPCASGGHLIQRPGPALPLQPVFFALLRTAARPVRQLKRSAQHEDGVAPLLPNPPVPGRTLRCTVYVCTERFRAGAERKRLLVVSPPLPISQMNRTGRGQPIRVIFPLDNSRLDIGRPGL